MKFLAFVDLHEDRDSLKLLVKRALLEDVDFLVCAGDLSIFGRSLRFVLKQLDEIGKKVYIITGNHETEEMMEKVMSDYPNCRLFDKKSFEIENYVFLGYGGGGFMFEDPNFRKIARDWYGSHQGKKIVLVTHGPPFGTKVDLVEKRYVGNKDFRAFIERIKPKLNICGHIHENAGIVDEIGDFKTKVVNPGWEGMMIELK